MKLLNYAMHCENPRQPELTNAYLVGGGIGSLTAAVHLIHDAHVPASQVHILESGSRLGGFINSTGTPETGYVLQGGQMLNFSYECLRDLLSIIPSLANPAKTVMQEINEFNAVIGNKMHAKARLVTGGAHGLRIVDVKHMGLSARDKYNLIHLVVTPEKKLDTLGIRDCFEKTFFRSKFWIMWSTM
jgi:oleate hydratase